MINEYKDSPLGKIPKNWDVEKLGKLAKTFAGGTPKRGVTGYYGGSIPWIKSGEVNNNSIEGAEEHVTELALKESSTKLIEANSILVALYGATAGKVGVLKVMACSNQAVLAVSSKHETLSNKFLYHYLKKCTSELLNLCQGSGQPNLSKGIVDSVQIPLPSLPEQQKIAEILNTVDNKIEVIDQQIIETQELKKGLMQRLLTRGIGHTEFKDSPLGEIPKSWEVVKLEKHSKKITDGSHHSPVPQNGTGLFIATVKDMKENRFSLDKCANISEEDFDLLERNGCKPQINDVLFSKDGTIGKTFVYKENQGVVLLSSVAIIRLFEEKLNPHFVCQVLKSDVFYNQLKGLTSGSAIRRLVLKAIKEIKLTVKGAKFL